MSRSDREKWDERYSCSDDRMGDSPRDWLVRVRDLLPASGRVLDIAAGEGQNAVFLAGMGFEVTAVDISKVGLAKAEDRASQAGVVIQTVKIDLEEDPAFIQPESYDAIICFRYLQRNLTPRIQAGLVPGGIAVLELPNRKSLERGPGPSDKYLPAEGELRNWLPDLETLRFEEDWERDKYYSRIVARKPDRRTG